MMHVEQVRRGLSAREVEEEEEEEEEEEDGYNMKEED